MNSLLRPLAALFGEMSLQRERRETLLLMFAALLTVLPHLPSLSPWISLGFFCLLGWRLMLLLTRRPPPGALMRWLAVLAACAVVFASHRTLFGREAGVALLVLMLGLKMLEQRGRRDQFVAIFLGLFLLLTAFLESQSIGTAVLVLIAVYALILNMLTMQLHGREMPMRPRLRASATLLAQALPLTVLLFVLFPRIQGPLWGMPGDTRTATTGLSETMTPGDITQLTDSEAVAFRVLFDAPPPEKSALYWRGPVLGTFDGRQWSALRRPVVPLPSLQVVSDRPTIGYTVTLEATRRPWLLALEAPVQIIEPQPPAAYLSREMMLVSRRTVADRTRYRLESATDFRVGLNESPLTLRNWVELPAGFNRKTLTLAGDWRAQTAEPQQLVRRALTMFREQPFRYTRSPPALGRDSVDDFLFNTRAGFCEHYASAFVVLMRALDIPARVVTGYQGGELNPVDGYLVVRQSDAHAWAEVWLAGQGWVRIDPTAAVAPERVERGARALLDAAGLAGFGLDSRFALRLRMNLDAMVNAWNQWVLGFDERSQLRLLDRLGLKSSDWKALAGMLAVGLSLLLGTMALVMMRNAQARDPLDQGWADFCARLSRCGIKPAPHETARQLLERASQRLDDEALAAATQIVNCYNSLRYQRIGPPERADMRHFRALIRAFKP